MFQMFYYLIHVNTMKPIELDNRKCFSNSSNDLKKKEGTWWKQGMLLSEKSNCETECFKWENSGRTI